MDPVHPLSALVEAALRAENTSDFLGRVAAYTSRSAADAPVSIEYQGLGMVVSAAAGPSPGEPVSPQTFSWRDSETDSGIVLLVFGRPDVPGPSFTDATLSVMTALATLLERHHDRRRIDVNARSVIQSSPLPTAIIRSDGVILNANDAFSELTAIGLDHARDSWSLISSQAIVEVTALERALETAASGTAWEGGLTIQTEGDRRPCDAVLARMVRDEPNELLLTLYDRTDQLRVQREAIAREKLATAGEIASGVAHEVNNPLAAIRIEAELLLSSTDSKEAAESAQVIMREVDRASRIARMLIHLTRRTDRELRPIQLNDLMKEVVDLRSHMDHWKDIDLHLELDPLVPLVTGPVSDLRQVFFNLVVNAEDAVEGATSAVIEARSELVESGIRVSVSDSGSGVPVEMRQRIFDPFFTTKDPDKGSGLGLSLSHGVVAELGGKIWAEESPLGGARFVIELPQDSDQ